MKNTLVMSLIIIFITNLTALAGPPDEVWNYTYESGGNDRAQDVTVDKSGNVCVTGYNGLLNNICAGRTIKYDSQGDILWNDLYDEDNRDAAFGIASDQAGNLYVAGFATITSDQCLLIKYAPGGNRLWAKNWGENPNTDRARAVAADASGNAYLTGGSFSGTNGDFLTMKYDPSGNLMWNKTYDQFGYDEGAFAAALDASGNLYVGGLTEGEETDHLLLVKYDPAGNVLWSLNSVEYLADIAYAIAVDEQGFAYIAGSSFDADGEDEDFLILKYDAGGDLVWKKRFGDANLNYFKGIAVDKYFVYVTGSTFNGNDFDILTLCYEKDGDSLWEMTFDSGDDDEAEGIALDNAHNIYIAGHYLEADDYDFRVIKYEQADYPVSVSEEPVKKGVSLDLANSMGPSITLRYSFSSHTTGVLTFYSCDGRKLESYNLDPCGSTFTWSASEPAGVYFARLNSGTESATVKIIR